MIPQRDFEIGQQVFDEGGRSGEITQVLFDDDDGSWIYEVTGLGTKADFQISGDAPPGTQLEPEPLGDVEEEVGDSGNGEGGFPEAEEGLIGTSGDISGYRVPPTGLTRADVESIVRSWVNLHRIEVNNQLRALETQSGINENLANELSSIRDSISELVAQQVRVENRQLSDYEALSDKEFTEEWINFHGTE